MKSEHIGIILLAAGASRRLGTPKQLLQYQGGTLLHHSIQVAVDSDAATVVVVLGANMDEVANTIDTTSVQVAVNEQWQEGISTSLKCGLRALTAMTPDVDAAIVMLCDQPHVTAALLNDLMAAYTRTGKPIVASSYGDTLGVPALFHKSIFHQLQQLTGDTGARKIIEQHIDNVTAVSFPMGSVDIDTGVDYEQLTKSTPPQ